MFKLEKRPQQSQKWIYLSPFLAVLITMISGGILFAALGENPFEAIRIIFWDPLFDPNFASYSRPQLLCLLYTSPSPRDGLLSRMPSSA